ncbi:MAG: hypothetical protein V4572_09285 [Bacteroidota bacterium]
MRTPRYISRTIGFLRNLNISPKENTTNVANFELTNNGFGISLKKNSRAKGKSNPLLTFMYSEENNHLFI